MSAKKSAHPLMQLLVMLAMALVMLIVASLFSAAFLMEGPLSRPAMLEVQAVTQILTFAVPVLAMTLIYYRGQQREYYRLDASGHTWLMALAGIVVMLLVVPLNEWLTQWNDGWDLGKVGETLRSLQDTSEGLVEQMFSTTTVGGLVSNLVVIALVPAICEELFFRAGIQNLLQRWLRNPHVAIILTAVIFSLGHGEIFAFMPRFVLGALLGYLYVYGGSLIVNSVAHFTNNAIVVVLYWLVARGTIDIDPAAPLEVGTLLIVCCTLAALLLFIVTFKRTTDC